MADFVQTMKDWRRMCMAMEKLRPNDACAGCRLEGYGCPAIYENNSHVDFRDVEKQVSEWAEAHPDPVYPTWLEWLMNKGFVTASSNQYGTSYNFDWDKPIPADIAQRLGLEPKENA